MTNDVTRILQQIQQGDQISLNELLPLVYQELRRLAANQLAEEKHRQSLNATALVHEAYLRLVGEQNFENRRHFFGAAAESMRRILVERARSRQSLKAGGRLVRVDLHESAVASPDRDDELLTVDSALDRLATADPQAAQLVHLRYFAGCTLEEAAELQGISLRSANRLWAYAKAWLLRELQSE